MQLVRLTLPDPANLETGKQEASCFLEHVQLAQSYKLAEAKKLVYPQQHFFIPLRSGATVDLQQHFPCLVLQQVHRM